MDYTTKSCREFVTVLASNEPAPGGGGASALVAAIGIMLFQQLVGINSVIYFLPQVFIKGFGFPENHAIWVSVGIGVVNFVATIAATLIMDKFPRKKLLIFGSVTMTIALAVLAVLNFTGDVATLAVPTMVLIACYILASRCHGVRSHGCSSARSSR